MSDTALKDRREPTFLVIGAMKAGTTSLHRYLSNHPDVFMSAPKELDFFATEKNWSRGWEWYLSQFQDGDVAMLRGESSTNYAKYPRFRGVAGRIHGSLPDVKLIYLLRDPVARCLSHVLHQWGTNGKAGVMAQDILDPHVVACSSYAMQIEQYLQSFPSSQMLIVFSEDLLDDRRNTMQRAFSFLGAEPVDPPGLHTQHGATADDELVLSTVGSVLPDAGGLDRDVRRQLGEHLLPDIDRLRGLLVEVFDDHRGARHVESWRDCLTG